jgi:hypothetical protein
MRLLRSALIAVPALAMSCSTCQPPPDPDGTRSGALALEVGSWRRDSLDCGKGDCADWYTFETTEEGKLQVDLARVVGGAADEKEQPAFSLVLSDAEGAVLEEVQNQGRPRVVIMNPKEKDHYLAAQRFAVTVATPAEGEGKFDYELRVVFTPKPKPKPAPRAAPAPKPAAAKFRTVKGQLLEVEARPDGGETVLIDQGSRSGVERGQRGRLLNGGRKVAEIEILDVYPDGSRALVRGSLGSALTPDTVAEVDVPL